MDFSNRSGLLVVLFVSMEALKWILRNVRDA